MPVLDFKETEEKIRKFWEKEKIYKFNPRTNKKTYSIDTPPPTVSGKMHMGHAFSFSQQDFIARYKRMKGFNVFYPFGTDDNGLATEKLVQKERGVDLRRISRDKAIKTCLEFLEDERPSFIQDWKNIGMSCDFDILYSTIDDKSRAISQKSFLDLAKKDLVYRKEAPILWDTVFQTAIAQAELEDKEMKSSFNDLIFKVDGKDLIIATTRPELLGACVAVFINPKDKKHGDLIGKKAVTPLYGMEVPIMADEKVDMEKGTGIVMCCTFGDQTDVEWYKQYNLPLRMLINSDGTMNEKSGKYKGMKIRDAREKIIRDLKQQGFLKNQKEIVHTVQVGERSGEPIEIINSMQWYVKYLDKKEELLEGSNDLNWYPKHMKHKLDNWILGLRWDWSISRQRNFGVPIPVWYCEKCMETVLADEKQLPVDPVKDKPLKKCKCGSDKFISEKDVFDTWFTSGSSPSLAIELMPENVRKKLFPMSLRPQAHDIINFWLFYTLAKSRLLNKKNPWKDVVISGWALDPKGEKMSKSKGNVIEPQKVAEKYGSDALRYWAASSKLGEDISYQEKELVAGRRLINKLKNAARFVFINLDGKPKKPKKLKEIDELFLKELNRVILTTTYRFENYEYSRAKFNTEEFFWKFFCDFYLEVIKKRVYHEKGKKKESAQYTLYHSLLAILKMMAPITPYTTEEIYQEYFRKYEKDKSIHVSEWPKWSKEDSDKWVDESVISHANELTLFSHLLTKVRQEKTNNKKPMNAECIVTIEKTNYNDLKKFLDDFKNVTNAREIKEGKFKVDFV